MKHFLLDMFDCVTFFCNKCVYINIEILCPARDKDFFLFCEKIVDNILYESIKDIHYTIVSVTPWNVGIQYLLYIMQTEQFERCYTSFMRINALKCITFKF